MGLIDPDKLLATINQTTALDTIATNHHCQSATSITTNQHHQSTPIIISNHFHCSSTQPLQHPPPQISPAMVGEPSRGGGTWLDD
jgi:hypothetical protein